MATRLFRFRGRNYAKWKKRPLERNERSRGADISPRFKGKTSEGISMILMQ